MLLSQVTEQYHRTVDLLESPDSFRLPYKYPTTHPKPHKTLANLTQSSLVSRFIFFTGTLV